MSIPIATATGFVTRTIRIGFAGLLILSGLMLGAEEVRASFYTCQTESGETVFQDRPCAEVTQSNSGATVEKAYPMGMDKSWFKHPEEVDEKPFCDQLGCECGRYTIDYERSLSHSLAEALFLETQWMNYEMAFESWRMAPSNSAELQMQRLLMVEAACDLMMTQELLLKYSEPVIEKLEQRYEEATQRGFDQPEACDEGDELACKYYNAVQLYEQILFDIEALRHPRMSLF